MQHWLWWMLLACLVLGGVGFVVTIPLDMAPLLAYLIAVNVTAFVIYGLDKRAATNAGGSRAPNPFLILLALVGGCVGALAGVYLWRHKTGPNYTGFRLALWLILLVYLILAFLFFVRPAFGATESTPR